MTIPIIQKDSKALSVTCGDSSPKGRGKMFSRVLLPFRHSLHSAISPKGRGKGCSHGTPKGV